MIRLLEIKHQRKILLVNLLFSQEEGLPIEEISEVLEYSESTIVRDIEDLNKYYKELISINKQDLRDISLTTKNSENIHQLRYLILNQSNNLQLLTEILINPFQKVKVYANKLRISASYIYKMISKINESLKEFNIKIISVNNKLFIDSKSEIILRKLFTIYLVETNEFNLDNIFQSFSIFKDIEKEIRVDKKIYRNLPNIYYLCFIFVSLMREEQGFYLTQDIKNFKKVSHKERVEEIITSFSYSPFDDNPFFYNRSFFLLMDYLKSLAPDNELQVIKFFKIITRIFENEISHQIPLVLFINRFELFHFTLKNETYLYLSVKNIIKNISEILHLNLADYEVFLSYILVIHFPFLLDYNQKKTLFIFSNLSITHSMFLKRYFSSILDDSYEFHIIYNKDNINEQEKNSIILTNDLSLNVNNKFLINDYPKRRDVINLKKKISQVYFYQTLSD